MVTSNTVHGVVFCVKNTIPVAFCSQIQAEVPGSVHFSDKDGDFTILDRKIYTKSAVELKKAKKSTALVSVSEGSPAVTPRVIIRKDGSRYMPYLSFECRRSVDSPSTTPQQSERFFLGHYHTDTSSEYSSNRSSPVSTTSTTCNDNLVVTSNTIHTAVTSQVPTKVISLSADERTNSVLTPFPRTTKPVSETEATEATQSIAYKDSKPLPPPLYPIRKAWHAFERIPLTFVHPGNNLGRSASIRAYQRYLESEAKKTRQREMEEAEARRTAYMYTSTTRSSTPAVSLSQATCSLPPRLLSPHPVTENTHMALATGAPTARLVTGQHIHQVAPESSAYHAVERVLPQARSSVTAAPVPQVARLLPPIPQPVVRNTHLVSKPQLFESKQLHDDH
ncbi:hypothetical protein M422DRAFT_265727 [Sphaerobolus stellatus SS14]|uniref:Uncharacterized protein n=1 Tax=Sphaerobolus stellatus (strain SS14) TaxID=990650 RepID=A0A0C9V4S2_SPHS4|nr:hypothetical protein M422DRAFT_265727 [Sphaerobolus stellatus SS14]